MPDVKASKTSMAPEIVALETIVENIANTFGLDFHGEGWGINVTTKGKMSKCTSSKARTWELTGPGETTFMIDIPAELLDVGYVGGGRRGELCERLAHDAVHLHHLTNGVKDTAGGGYHNTLFEIPFHHIITDSKWGQFVADQNYLDIILYKPEKPPGTKAPTTMVAWACVCPKSKARLSYGVEIDWICMTCGEQVTKVLTTSTWTTTTTPTTSAGGYVTIVAPSPMGDMTINLKEEEDTTYDRC